MNNVTNRALMYIVLLVMFSCLTAPLTHATILDGKDITTAFYFPDQSTIGFGGVPIETTVGPDIEIDESPQGFPITSIDFSDTSIELDFFRNLSGTVAPFNGWRFFDTTNTIPTFTNAILTTSNTTGWTVSFDADNIWLNGSGSTYFEDSTLRIDISAEPSEQPPSAVPEPATITCLILGLAGIAYKRRKRINTDLV